MNKRVLFATTIIAACLSISVILRVYFHYSFVSSAHYVSPEGKQIEVKFDFMGVPTVFYKNKVVMGDARAGDFWRSYAEVFWETENRVLLLEMPGRTKYWITLDD